jgi:hypothetical protein
MRNATHCRTISEPFRIGMLGLAPASTSSLVAFWSVFERVHLRGSRQALSSELFFRLDLLSRTYRSILCSPDSPIADLTTDFLGFLLTVFLLSWREVYTVSGMSVCRSSGLSGYSLDKHPQPMLTCSLYDGSSQHT